MKARFFTVLSILLFAAQVPSFAGDDDSYSSFGTRYSVGADKKIVKGFHVFANEEVRLDGFSDMDRLYTNIGTSYKINDYLKVGAGYSAISVWRENDEGVKAWDWRHRAAADVTGMYSFGDLKLSLKEKFQATYKTRDVNTYEQPKTDLALKSRFKVSYKNERLKGVEPYVFVEHRLSLNGAKWDENAFTENYKQSEFIGNSDVYTSRIRSQVGVQWKIGRHNSFEIYGLYDRITDKDIEAKRAKGTLKSPILTYSYNYGAVGLSYTFSF